MCPAWPDRILITDSSDKSLPGPSTKHTPSRKRSDPEGLSDRTLRTSLPRSFLPSGDLLRFVPDGLVNRPGAVRVLLVLSHQGGVPERGSASEGEGGASRAVHPLWRQRFGCGCDLIEAPPPPSPPAMTPPPEWEEQTLMCLDAVDGSVGPIAQPDTPPGGST